MDLFIETLTGTAFELRVSPFETIMSVKAKIQRLEGIPISQQHLIWRSVELEDDYCLHDYNITDGATLQLVLAMRGGPINTRRIPVEDPTLREMAEYMEVNREEIWDKLPKDNRQVTLLVFRDGDQLNFFRVVDRGDGTLTPLSDSLSGASMYNLYDEEEEENPPPISQEVIKENSVTMNKMRLLKNRMESQKSLKPKHQPAPPTSEKPTSTSMLSARRRLQLSSASGAPKADTAFRVVDQHSSSRHQPKAGGVQGSPSKQSSATSRVTPKGPLPPVNTRRKTNQIDVSDFLVPSSQEAKIVPSSRTLARSAMKEGRKAISELVKDSKEIKPLGSISKPVSHHKETRTSSPSHGATSLDYSAGSASLRRSRIPEDSSDVRYPLDLTSGSGGFRRIRAMENRIPTPEGRRSGLLNDSLSYSYRLSHGSTSASNSSPSHLHHLPPVKTKPHPPPQLLPAKKKTRCFTCGKKTGIATTYQCRCGNSFCATHRYAEAHSCTYDYKSEGRKIIEQNNPVIAAPKLPKI